MTNADKLRQIKADYGLATHKIAKMLDRNPKTVSNWLLTPDSPHSSRMPDDRLKELEGLLVDMDKV